MFHLHSDDTTLFFSLFTTNRPKALAGKDMIRYHLKIVIDVVYYWYMLIKLILAALVKFQLFKINLKFPNIQHSICIQNPTLRSDHNVVNLISTLFQR